MQYQQELQLQSMRLSGTFIPNENLSFNGVSDGRIAIAVTEHSITDVKSVYATNRWCYWN